MKKPRIIFHIDMNAFFASCEIAENRELLGKPVVVAHNDPLKRSIILTASYEARKYGIKTTMLVREALKLCPELVVVEPDMNLYKHYSKLFFEYLYTITNLIEPGSIDEAYMDVSDLYDKVDFIELAKKIQTDLYQNYLLPCSIGIGPNKFLAKMASDMKKPLGITVLRKREIEQLLWPLPIEKMYGVGKKTAPRLRSIGINTIGDLANYSNLDLLKDTVGENHALGLQERARGEDNSPVESNNDEVSSMSNSHTFEYEIYDEQIIKKTLKVLVNTLSNRLERKNLLAQTFGIQLKYNNYRTINRSKPLDIPTNNSNTLYSITLDLLEEYHDFTTPLRLVGVFANRLVEGKEDIKQYSIFEINELEKENEIHKLLLNLQKTYGKNVVSRGIKKNN
ncbi:MAG TPA: DNA polymerase IV [Bacilli bacterium]|nr:DNA polymerase IV [Bacilli bacterium]HQD91736.1 DNA polymerase IV [Bacilli bacterium]